MHDCFISYSHKDAQIAIAIQSILEQHNIKCWIDFRDAAPGIDYAQSIVHAIKESKIFIIVLSKNSTVSPHVLNEVNSAVNSASTILPFKVDDGELNESMEYYLGRTHWMDALTPPMETHIMKLVEVVQTHLHGCAVNKDPAPTEESRKKSNSMNCRMLKFQDLISLGYTSETIAIQLVENDYINCNGIGMENEGTAQQWEEYLQNNSETFQYLVNAENKIVGDWSIVALDDQTFAQAKNGELLEADIDMDKTELICFPGVYNGYILTMSILPQYRNMKNYSALIESFLLQLEEYAENGIFFRSWCMNVFSKEVESFMKRLGFKYVTENKVFGKIYYCDFMPLPELPIYKKRHMLVERYNNAES